MDQTPHPDKAYAFQNVSALVGVAREPGIGLTALADVLGRDKSNLAETLGRLADNGFLTRDPWAVTPAGHAIIAAAQVAEGQVEAQTGVQAEGQIILRHDQIYADSDNARRDWDSEEAQADLLALAADIAANGLLQNLVVRLLNGGGDQGPYVLVGGERRWRAIGELIAAGDWPADRAIPCRLLDADEVGVRLAALAENLQRRNLNPIEEATAYRGLRDAGLTTDQIAERVSLTQRHVQMRLQLLDCLSDADQARMTLPRDDPKFLSVRDARQLVQAAETKRKALEKAMAEFTPRQRLILAELRAAANGGDLYQPIQIDGDAAAQDPDAQALEKAGAITLPTTVDDQGRATARCEHRGWDLAQTLFPEGAAAGATELRDQLGLREPEEGRWSIPWLNGPFAISPELQARLDARNAEREESMARGRALEDERDAARRAQHDAWTRAREQAAAERALQAEHPTVRPSTDRIAAIAALAEHPLPWTPTPNGWMVDADGGHMFRVATYAGADDQDLALADLIALAVNAAAEQATPAEPPLPVADRPLDRDAFLAVMAQTIADYGDDDRAALNGADAPAILTAHLADIDADFGDPEHGWTARHAAEVVHAYPPSDEDDDPDAASDSDDAEGDDA
ncbi:ParB N-terminal domain-containing protein [uncultured Brevundimonas sp.]|uniref:ParB/RepB/Spo0J family partition protein n=1 Tax=uncultured Brevundimonas sp. TaxID=213418 RepID=UPI00261F13F5|nr:ParB N-terminal domain-containing protein [uncultured Brevundimonas sp.]